MNEDDNDDSDIDDSYGDLDLSSDEPIWFHTRSQRKTPESPSDGNANDVSDRSNVTTDKPVAQEIENQSDSNSYKSADSGSDDEDGHVSTHSPPLAIRKSASQRKLPAKYHWSTKTVECDFGKQIPGESVYKTLF